jgi:hypothetical protein
MLRAENSFSPLLFLASLGAGGIAVAPFAFFQYTLPHGAGLIRFAEIGFGTPAELLVNGGLAGIAAVFAALHFVLTGIFLAGFFRWRRTEEARVLREDPLRNSALLALPLSLAMSLNVFIGPVRFFFPALSGNFQAMIAPGAAAWLAVWVFTVGLSLALLKTSFEKSFDVAKISFGWLLHPFALAMATVTGTGIAAMAKSAALADAAFFLSAISGSMAALLFAVKLVAIFKSHFAAPGLPEKEFLPSFLIVVPIVTLLAISAFRAGHFLEKHHGAEPGNFFLLVTAGAWALEFWWLAFGFLLLKDWLRKDFGREFSVTHWGLVCPAVAFAVLGSFVFKSFAASAAVWWLVFATIWLAVALFFFLLARQVCCLGILSGGKQECR